MNKDLIEKRKADVSVEIQEFLHDEDFIYTLSEKLSKCDDIELNKYIVDIIDRCKNKREILYKEYAELEVE